MEQILSSFVAIHIKKNYKGYVGFYRKWNDKPKTLYRVYIDLAIFNSIPNNYNELNSLFLFIKNKSNSLKNQIQDQYLLKYFENFILKSNNLNSYIEKINSQNYDYTLYTNIINKFILFINATYQDDIKQISKKIITNTKHVFIGIRFTDEYKIIANVIKDIILKCNLIPRKIDEIMHNENIDSILYQEMDNSDFGIFELTSENKNVYYETGYLDGKGKQTILIVKAGTKIPFDLDHKSRVIYNDLNDLKQKLYEKIEHIKSKIY